MYILRCKDGSLYTGSTNDLPKRLIAHQVGVRGARYTKSRRPVMLTYQEKVKTKSAALKREWAIKQFTRKEKLELIKR